MLMIFLVSPSTSATSPLSRRVIAKMLSVLIAFIFLFGRFSTGTKTCMLSFISFMPHSGGAGGSCWRKRAIMSISPAVSSPDVPQLGMPAGEPKLISALR